MKTLKKILLFFIFLSALSSCLVDDETNYDLNEKGPNLAGFSGERTSFSFVSDGQEHQFTVKVKVFGPTYQDIKNNITMTIDADPSSTAIEGTHFRIEQPSITLDPDDNLLGLFPITVLTAGIEAPLDVAPKIVLAVTDASGDPTIVNSGKNLEITLNYGCFSDLAGDYSVVVTRTNYDGVVTTYPAFTESIMPTGVGTYLTSSTGHYFPGGAGYLGVAQEGFNFNDVCGQLAVPLQNLGNVYSNEVSGTEFGSVDPVTGVLTLKYQITFAAGIRTYVSVYTPIP